MNGSDVLTLLARDVRSDTLGILRSVGSSKLTWVPEGTSNHILWHAGHALWLQDLMCVKPIVGKCELPVGWAERFGMNSRPAEVFVWPTRDEVEGLLASQLERIENLLDDVTDLALSKAVPSLGGKRSLCGWIVHGLHDEAKHSGEMFLLWKLAKVEPQ